MRFSQDQRTSASTRTLSTWTATIFSIYAASLVVSILQTTKEDFMAASRLHPRFGLEIRSRDVRQCTAADIDEIRDLLRQFGVLLFRDQVLTDEDLYRFGLAIGDGRTAESADRIALSPANAAIRNLTNLHDDQQRPLGFGRNDTDYWHSDQEYRQSPATLASLYCLIPAERGGSTSFATTRVAPLNLPEDVLERLRGLKSTRRPA